MTIQNTTIPAALANDPDAERAALQAYLSTEEAQGFIGNPFFDYEDVVARFSPFDVADTRFENAKEFVAHIDEAIDKFDELASGYRRLLEGFIDHLGVQEAIEAVAQNLQTDKTEESVKALQHGFELTWNSDRKLSPELRQALIALGMPEKFRGTPIKSYRAASIGAWDRRILPTKQEADDEVEFIEEGETKNIGPDFVEMVPEDEEHFREG